MFSSEELAYPKVPNKSKRKEDIRFFTHEEDQVLMDHVLNFGTTWVECANKIPLRTPNSVRNRYNRLMKAQLSSKIYKCRLCGESKRGHICKARSFHKGDDVQKNLENIAKTPSAIGLHENDQLINLLLDTI